MPPQPLYTIGYEGLSLESFLHILQNHHIEQIIDIRRKPISRKPGFSKNVLAQSLEAAGIQYTHIVALGTPTDVRHELKETEDYDSFFASVEQYISQQGSSLHQALNLALQQPSALLCFERNPEQCHRLVVAAHIIRRSNLHLTVEHIWL